MQTEWNAFGLGSPADNMILADIYIAYTLPVVLQAIPGLPTLVHLPHLPAETAAVRLWAPLDTVWYAIDATPGPIPEPVTSSTVSEEAFVRGDMLKPGEERLCALPLGTGFSHTLNLISSTPFAQVVVTALTQII